MSSDPYKVMNAATQFVNKHSPVNDLSLEAMFTAYVTAHVGCMLVERLDAIERQLRDLTHK